MDQQEEKFNENLKKEMEIRYKAMNQKAIVFKGRKRRNQDSDDDDTVTESDITESDITKSNYTSNESFLIQ